MHLCNCLDPHRVRNKYTGEELIVPCGKCSICLSNKQYSWVHRLQQERNCWKYAVFFTLTYDEQHLPTATITNNLFIDDIDSFKRPRVLFDVTETSPTPRDVDYINRNCNRLGYLCKVDVQRFMKRYRTNLRREYMRINYKSIDYENQSDNIKRSIHKATQVRYYIVGEYGSSTYRPHYHGLFFFSSEFQASHVEDIIRKSWPHGHCDTSFDAGNSIKYIAAYLNSFAHLPSVYLHKKIRPFALYSRRPAIGTLSYNEQEIQKLFDSAATDMLIYDSSQSSFRNVPLLRSFVDKLYPKIGRFSTLSHLDRVRIYSIAEFCETFADFFHYAKSPKRSKFIRDYVRVLDDGTKNHQGLFSLFCISKRVCTQARVWNYSIDLYVKKIEEYYNKIDYARLCEQYKYQEDYTDQVFGARQSELMLLYLDFFWHVQDVPICDMEEYEINFLASFGVDLSQPYLSLSQMGYDFTKTTDYIHQQINYEKRIKDSTKTKKKNDYLAIHKQLAEQKFY